MSRRAVPSREWPAGTWRSRDSRPAIRCSFCGCELPANRRGRMAQHDRVGGGHCSGSGLSLETHEELAAKHCG